MPSESILLIAIVVVCVSLSLAVVVWTRLHEARPGTRQYRYIVDDLRKWRVLEPDELADTECVRKLVLNWARLSRPGILAAVVSILIVTLVAGGLFWGPPSIRPHQPVVAIPIEIALAFGLYVSIFLAELRASSRAQAPEAFTGTLPPYRLYTAGIRPVIRVAVGSVLVCTALLFGVLSGLIRVSDDSLGWTTVRSHPWLAMIVPVMILAMVAFCQVSIHRLSRLRPLRLAEDDMLSLRASVAFLQTEINQMHSLLAYFVALGVMQQFILLPYFGNFSMIFVLAAPALLLYATLQPLATRPMTLPPPELFTPANETMRQAEG